MSLDFILIIDMSALLLESFFIPSLLVNELLLYFHLMPITCAPMLSVPMCGTDGLDELSLSSSSVTSHLRSSRTLQLPVALDHHCQSVQSMLHRQHPAHHPRHQRAILRHPRGRRWAA